jgi:hypothetical protein
MNASHPCYAVVLMESIDRGQSWQYSSTVTEAGSEATLERLDDGRLMVVTRYDFGGHIPDLPGPPGAVTPYRQHFSSDMGRSWAYGGEMQGADGSPPPHSVMPTLKRTPGGYVLTGGRTGLYLWTCPDTACIDHGGWTATNIAAHHNAVVGATDPLGHYLPNCVNTTDWDVRNSTASGSGSANTCASSGYIGLAHLGNGTLLLCYDHASSKVRPEPHGWEVYCVCGQMPAHTYGPRR